MSLDKDQLKMVLQCSSAEELVQKAAEAGCDLSLEQAQSIIDSVSMVELSEEDLSMVAGGDGSLPSNLQCQNCPSTEFSTIGYMGGEVPILRCAGCGNDYAYVPSSGYLITIEQYMKWALASRS